MAWPEKKQQLVAHGVACRRPCLLLTSAPTVPTRGALRGGGGFHWGDKRLLWERVSCRRSSVGMRAPTEEGNEKEAGI
jgi:hypothetical protein